MAKAKKEERRVKYTSSRETAQTIIEGSESGAIRRPDGMDFFTPKKEGSYKLDILPYIVKKGKKEKGGNPHAMPGYAHFERSYCAHRGIGVNNKSYCCLSRTFGKKCPICEDRAKLMRDSDADPDLIKSLEPKDRQLFLVSEKGNEKAGVMLWDVSYHLFGKTLVKAINSADDDDRDMYENFYFLDGGSTLKVVLSEETMGKTSFLKTSNIEFKPRKEALDEDLLDKMPDLDSLLIEMSYDKLKAIYLQEEEEEEEDKSKKGASAKSSTKKKDEEEDDEEDDTDDDDEEEEDEKPAAKKGGKANAKKPAFKVGMKVEYEDEEMTVAKVSPDGSSLTLKDEDGKQHKAVDPDECVICKDDDEEEEEEEKPAPKKKGAAKKKDEEDEDEEDEDEEDEDEEDEDEEDEDEEDEDEEDEDEEDEDEKPAPKKRGPGRPRKS